MSFEALADRPAPDVPRVAPGCRIVIPVPAHLATLVLVGLRDLAKARLPASSTLRGYLLGARVEGDH